MATRSDELVPAFALHPGEVLGAELRERGIRQKDFAASIGWSATHLNEVIRGKRNMTEELAMRLEESLGIPYLDWMNLQSRYVYHSRAIAERDRAEQSAKSHIEELDMLVSIKDIVKRVGDKDRSPVSELHAIDVVMGSHEPLSYISALCGCFRKSDRVGADARMLRTWLVLAKHFAGEATVTSCYDAGAAEDIKARLHDIFMENACTLERIGKELSSCGVRFCVVENVDGASIDGFSFIDDAGVPCIVVTNRFNMIDQLALTVMRGLAHVVLGHVSTGGPGILDFDGADRSLAEEREADKFAADALIAPSVWRSLVKGRPSAFAWQRECAQWAEKNKVNKWVALGRMSREIGAYNVKGDSTRRVM